MKDLVKNPIGIIALFISLIYGFANLLLGTTANSLTPSERSPLIMFIVLFPVVVLGIFYLLVSRHHAKLYAPGDYKDDQSFLRTLSPKEREQKIEKDIEEVLPQTPSEPASGLALQASESQTRSNLAIHEELRLVEEKVISRFEREFNQRAERDVAVGDTGATFDALFKGHEKLTFLEIKAIRHPGISSSMILDRILYNALLADRSLNSNFKLIVAVVYSFAEPELRRLEVSWRRKIERCPAAVEARFIPRNELDS
jgi:hypothetical protein